MNPKLNTEEEERDEQDRINEEDDEEERVSRERESEEEEIDVPYSDDM